ncbi:hypothetical protein M3I01_013355 [Marinomonas sp. RSW2]|uniref:RecT family protein n=1 Tax=Marinomonas maritima TaxID=2940935 RepID=A0ABT5WHJ7_9GAMM|nr:hypothetical protein [Marinomonas maritima]MDE8603884.1 hypothetical protein [Marinomonas maritima]
MEKTIERIMQRKYPELGMGWHLPLWAKVVDNGEELAQQTATEQSPVYAVSVRLLDRYGVIDKDVPVIKDVLVPVPAGAANQRGQWSKPLVDTVVELAFAYGSPAHPFIRSILPYGLVLPSMGEKDQRWQQSEKSYIEITDQDDWTQKGSNSTIELEETEIVKAKNSTTEIEETETVKAKNSTTEIEEDLTQRIGQIREIIANKHWVGSEGTNIYQLLHDLMMTVSSLAKIAGAHNHSYTWSDPGGAATTSPPLQISSYNTKDTEATELAGSLQPLLK